MAQYPKFNGIRKVEETDYEPEYWEAEVLTETNVIEYRDVGWPSSVYGETKEECLATVRKRFPGIAIA